jgi:hypothetical protein
MSPSGARRAATVDPRRLRLLLGGGFLLGLAIRLALLRYRGTADTFTFEDWATKTQREGLAHAYGGIYFPLEYQVLAFAKQLAAWTGMSFVTSLKAIELACDLGCFGLLLVILRRLGAAPAWALLYWLFPYTLALFWLSYVDFQIGLLVLLCVACLWLRSDALAFAAASVPLGAAFVMKPQVILLVALAAVVSAFAVGKVVARREPLSEARPVLLLAGPALFFASYSAYFYKHGYGRLYLFHSYTQISQVFPALTANMPNIWYPVAWAEQRPAEPSYAVDGPHVLHTVGTALTVAIVLVLTWRVLRSWNTRSVPASVLVILAAGTLVAPMTETRAHENHLYIGWTLGIAVAAYARSTAFTAALLVLGFVDFANLLGIYAFGLNGISNTFPFPELTSRYGPNVRLADSLVAICAFGVLLFELYRLTGANGVEEKRLRTDHARRGKA